MGPGTQPPAGAGRAPDRRPRLDPGASASASAPASASKDERRLAITYGTVLAGAVVLVAAGTSGTRGIGSLLFFGVVAVVALDAIVAINATRRAVFTGRVHPCDVVVGDRFAFELAVGGSKLPLLVGLPGRTRPPLLVEPPAAGSLEGFAEERGVIHTFVLSARSTGLCGLIACTRSHWVRVPRHLEVGPRPVRPVSPFPDLGGGWGEGAAGAAHDAELVRGLRDYVPGDRLRQVHWRATAHTGELVVKETEEPQAPVLHVVLDLGAGGEAGEEAAGRAAWYAGEALRRGYQVTLTTVEDGHPLTDATPSLLQVNRRLARAGAGAPPRPKGVARAVRVLIVSDEGDSWPSN